jgi:hypothetical protein
MWKFRGRIIAFGEILDLRESAFAEVNKTQIPPRAGPSPYSELPVSQSALPGAFFSFKGLS